MSGASGHFLPLSAGGFDFLSPGGWRLEPGQEDHTPPGGGVVRTSLGVHRTRDQSSLLGGHGGFTCPSCLSPGRMQRNPDTLAFVMALVRGRADTFPEERVC